MPPPALQAVLRARHVAVPPAQRGLLVQVPGKQRLEFIDIRRAQRRRQQAFLHVGVVAGAAQLFGLAHHIQHHLTGQLIVLPVSTQAKLDAPLLHQLLKHLLCQAVALALQVFAQLLHQ